MLIIRIAIFDNARAPSGLYIQQWTGDAPIGAEEWGLNSTATYGNTTTYVQNGWMNITFTSDTSVIVKGGYTKLQIRTGDDISRTSISNDRHLCFCTVDNGNSTRNPKLYIEYTTNSAPTIGSVSGTNWDDTDNLYAQKKSYTCSITYTDTDGYADIHYCELYLRSSGNAIRAQLRYHEDDNSVATITGSTAWTLDSTATDFSRFGNNFAASWKFSAQWDATEESYLDFLFYVVDAAGASASSTSDQNFDVVTGLVTTPSADDPRINKAGTTTISCTVYYGNNPASNVASSSYPPDAEFTSVAIHNAAHSAQATDTTIVNGVYSVSFAIPNAVQLNTYHAYIDLSDADGTDRDAVNARALSH